jgi:ATP-dependent DNA helicase RecQ
MGIDKKDIRLIIHYNVTGSIENYYQEIGRAGRDSNESFAYLLYDQKDLAIQNFFLSNAHPDKVTIQKIYKAICDFNRIAVNDFPVNELIIDPDYISKYAETRFQGLLLHHSGILKAPVTSD